MSIRCLVVAILAMSTTLDAQWLQHPTRGVPRTPDGKPNLTAPAPHTADGKPDFSGSGSWNQTRHAQRSDARLTMRRQGNFSTLARSWLAASRISPGPRPS
jgi:hypothetical protein